MRLGLSILAAMLCHGVLFGVAAAVLSRMPPEQAARTQALEVEVVTATPDPIAEAAPPAAGDAERPAPAPPPLRRAHLVERSASVASRDAPVAALAPVVAGAATPMASAAGQANPSMAARTSVGSPSVRSNASPSPTGGGTVATAQPRYRTNAKPDYPIASQRRREEGVVLLNVAVDAGGTPTAISLNRSSGYPLLDRAALDAVRRWTFEPARAGGVPMFSQVVVPVRFSLDDRP